mgnify:CR=1 FL=1
MFKKQFWLQLLIGIQFDFKIPNKIFKENKTYTAMLVRKNNYVERTFDELLKDFFTDAPADCCSTKDSSLHFPPVNITESETAYHLDVKAPGFDKADFNINLDGNLLSISVEKKEDQKVKNPKFVRREFSFKSFKRSFTLDEKINAEKIDAKYENGILKLELPKKAVAKPDTRQISIQ